MKLEGEAMRPNLIQLERFVAAARKGTFTAAARDMYVTSQTVSQSVRDLECELNARLLDQRGKTLLITPIGAEVLRRAEGVLRGVDDIVRVVADRQADGLKTGSVSLAIASSPLRGGVFHRSDFARFEEDHPHVALRIEHAASEACLAELLEGAVDAAIVTGDVPVEECDALHLGSQPLYALLFRDHALASRRCLSLDDLRGEKIAVSYDYSGCRNVVRKRFRQRDVKPSLVSLEMDLSSHRRFLAAGGVVLVIPDACLSRLYPQSLALPFCGCDEILLPYRFLTRVRCANPAVPLVRGYVRQLACRLRQG